MIPTTRCTVGARIFKDWQVVKIISAIPQALAYEKHSLDCHTCGEYDRAGSYSMMHPAPQMLLREAAPHLQEVD